MQPEGMEDLNKVFNTFIDRSYKLEKQERKREKEREKEKEKEEIKKEKKIEEEEDTEEENEKETEKETKEENKKEKQKETKKIHHTENKLEQFNTLLDEEDFLNDGWIGSVLTYGEYSLSGLYMCEEPFILENDKNYETLINVLIKSTDVYNDCEWIDCYYVKKNMTEEINILKPGKQKEEYIYREYRKPHILKNVCIFKRSSPCIFKTSEVETVDSKTIRESQIPKYNQKTFKLAGFYLSHTLFVKAKVFHKKYGNSDHLVILVMRHYKDPFFEEPLFADRVLVQIKSDFTSRKYAKIKHMNILHFAQILKPFLSLRKIDEILVEEQRKHICLYA